MLLKPKNIVPQKCSVHKIITGFIKNINSWCTTGGVVQSQRDLCQPPAPLPPQAPEPGNSGWAGPRREPHAAGSSRGPRPGSRGCRGCLPWPGHTPCCASEEVPLLQAHLVDAYHW